MRSCAVIQASQIFKMAVMAAILNSYEFIYISSSFIKIHKEISKAMAFEATVESLDAQRSTHQYHSSGEQINC